MSGMEFRLGNRRVVHHALVYSDSAGTARKLAADSPDGGYACFGGPTFPPVGLLGGWAPGASPPPDSPSLSQLIRQGTDIVVQIHYHPSGKPEEDQSSLGLKFSSPPTKGRAGIILSNRRIAIPAGDAHYVVKTSVTVPRDVDCVRHHAPRALSGQRHAGERGPAGWNHPASDPDQGLGFQLAGAIPL